jgi:death-on-curing protein
MLSAKDVMAIHDLVLAEEGGLSGDHGLGAVEGALARVVNHIDYAGMDDVFEIAAMYAVAIARGHVFNDANKRTALVSALAYLGTEGISMKRSAQLEEIMVDVAEGLLDAPGLADVLFALHTASN